MKRPSANNHNLTHDHDYLQMVSYILYRMNKQFYKMKKYLSTADLIVILITFLLFLAALFTKGLTHDILLEAGVLLVSIKIIMMNYKNISSNNAIEKKLDEIRQALKRD